MPRGKADIEEMDMMVKRGFKVEVTTLFSAVAIGVVFILTSMPPTIIVLPVVLASAYVLIHQQLRWRRFNKEHPRI